MREGGDNQAEDETDEWGDDLAESAWIAGVDYLRGWAEARDAVAEMSAALVGLGCPPECFRAAPGTGLDGAGVVRLHASPAVIRRLAGVLWLAERGAYGGLCGPVRGQYVQKRPSTE